MNAPNGWISHDLLIWNELDKRGFVAKGLVLEVPDLRHAGDRALNSFYESVRQFLHTLEESTRAQFRWSVDSDYREEKLSRTSGANRILGLRSPATNGSTDIGKPCSAASCVGRSSYCSFPSALT
jgi:hypothetical protein